MSKNFCLKWPIIALIFGLSYVFLPSDLRVFANSWTIVTGTLESDPDWDRTIGEGWNLTLIQTIEGGMATGLIQTTDGNFVLCGIFLSTGYSYQKGTFFMKIDSNGVVLWNQVYEIIQRDEATSVLQTADGGYLLAGRVRLSHTQDDMWLFKTDPNGVALWNRTYGSPGNDICHSLIQTKDGGLLLVGTICRYNEEERGIWLLKTDPDGVAQWNRTYGVGDPGTGSAESVLQTADGGFLLAGWTRSYGTDMLLIKTDPNGVVLWNRTYGSPAGDERCYSMIPTKDGNMLLVGRTQPSSYSRDADILLVKVDFNGVALWNQTYGSSKFTETAHNVIQTPDGGFLVVGNTRLSGDFCVDILLLKTDNVGLYEWNLTTGKSGLNDYCCDIVQTTDEDFMLAGYSCTWSDEENSTTTLYMRLLKLENPLKSLKSIPGLTLVSSLGGLCAVLLVIQQKKTWRKAKKSFPQA